MKLGMKKFRTVMWKESESSIELHCFNIQQIQEGMEGKHKEFKDYSHSITFKKILYFLLQ